MMTSHLQGPAQLSPVSSDSFRPAKRRRFYRKRTDTEDDEASDNLLPQTAPTPELQTVEELISQNGNIRESDNQIEDEAPLSVADLIRQRKAIQRRRGGIEFTNFTSSVTANPDNALVVKEDDTPADVKSVIERFAPQTGQISDTTDKHMYVLPSRSFNHTRSSD